MRACPACGEENQERFRLCGFCGQSLGPAESARVRKTVTVLFSDICDSTSLGERLDPESLRKVMSQYFEAARTVIERHGGTVEKFIGARRPMLSPGREEQLPLMSRELYNMGLKPENRHQAAIEQRLPELYHSDRVFVIVSFDTPLGSHVVQTYRWLPNAHPQDQEIVWEMRSLVIADGHDDPEPFRMEWR